MTENSPGTASSKLVLPLTPPPPHTHIPESDGGIKVGGEMAPHMECNEHWRKQTHKTYESLLAWCMVNSAMQMKMFIFASFMNHSSNVNTMWKNA